MPISYIHWPATAERPAELTKPLGPLKGAASLRALADASDFWNRQPYPGRLHFGPGADDYVSRATMQAAAHIANSAPPEERLAAECRAVLAECGFDEIADTMRIPDAIRHVIAKLTQPKPAPAPVREPEAAIADFDAIADAIRATGRRASPLQIGYQAGLKGITSGNPYPRGTTGYESFKRGRSSGLMARRNNHLIGENNV